MKNEKFYKKEMKKMEIERTVEKLEGSKMKNIKSRKRN